MCRLLGVVARQPQQIGGLLADDLDPFLALACEHKDGWGVGLRAGDGTVRSVKDPERGDRSDRLRAPMRREARTAHRGPGHQQQA